MERLSEAAIEIVNALHRERLDYESEYSPLIDALNRLAAYEDTGLEPEEIVEFVHRSEITPQQEYFISEKADSIIAGLKELIVKVDERNHVTELLQAEAEGRLLVLPCKVGDPVYYLTGNPILASGYYFNRVESTKCIGFYFDEKGLQICLYMPHGNHGTYGYYGKTIFLTREEAEAALKAEEE